MTALRFIHTSDLHLGKPFGWAAEADRLRVARRGIISRLVAVARDQKAPHVLVAGDLFETPNPSPSTWRQAIAEMAEAAKLNWWLLPGNHDNLREAQATWDAIRILNHPNVHVLDAPEAIAIQNGAFLLPAPLTVRHPASDPTGWMTDCKTPHGSIRVGLGHGPVKSFGEGEVPADLIAMDRDRSARLDYLALGDWHGQMRVSDRLWYSGTPEFDRFKHDGKGACLIVDIAGPGAVPIVTPMEIGIFDWRILALSLLPTDDPEDLLKSLLPDGMRRDTLLRIIATGHAQLSATSMLAAMESTLGPEFCHFELQMGDLALEVEAEDLDTIASSGALRQTADFLAAEAGDPYLSARDRAVAAAALRRLHAIVSRGAK